jgi:F0F1-type ATP synthase assembly protein I
VSGWREKKYRDLREIAEDERNRQKREGGRAHLYALEIPTSVIVGAVLGKIADDHFHIAPIGITLGLLAGIGAAVRAIIKVIAWQKSLSAGDPPATPMPDDPPGGPDDRHP